jgi:hypothetical protein
MHHYANCKILPGVRDSGSINHTNAFVGMPVVDVQKKTSRRATVCVYALPQIRRGKRVWWIVKVTEMQYVVLKWTNVITNSFINKPGCYNESGGILFIMESSIIVLTRERLCIRLFMDFIRESLCIVFTKERLFMFSNLSVQCIRVK